MSSAGKSYPRVSGGAFFSRHEVWLLFSVEEAGASEVNCGKRLLWLVQPQAVSPGWDREGDSNKPDFSSNLQLQSK